MSAASHHVPGPYLLTEFGAVLSVIWAMSGFSEWVCWWRKQYITIAPYVTLEDVCTRSYVCQQSPTQDFVRPAEPPSPFDTNGSS